MSDEDLNELIVEIDEERGGVSEPVEVVASVESLVLEDEPVVS
jgi:hypothetical protein